MLTFNIFLFPLAVDTNDLLKYLKFTFSQNI